MYCKQCGKQIPDSSSFCPECGARTGGAQAQETASSYAQTTQSYVQQQQANQPYGSQSAPSQPYAQAPVPGQPNVPYGQPSTIAPADPKYQKLGGWLMFFVICWVVGGVYGAFSGIQALTGSFSYLSSYGMDNIGLTLLLVSVVGIAAGAFDLAMAYFVYQRNHVFLRIYQLFTIVVVALYVILGLFAGGTLVASGVGAAVELILLTLYFCKSVRVRTYMGGTEYIDRALFRIGA